MAEYKLALEKREVTGKKLKNLRATGLIPSVIYGGKEPILSASEYVPTEKVLNEAGYHSPIDLDMAGKKQMAIVKDVQIDPILIGDHSAFAYAGFAISVVPELQPVSEGHFRIDGIGTQLAGLLHCLFELQFALCFGLGKHTLGDGIAVLFIADHIAPFIGAVRLFDYTACSACSSFLSQGFSPFPKILDMKSSVTTAACFCMSLVTWA